MTLIETDQSREIGLTEVARGPFLIRYLSYRKSEDAALNLRSEDYIVSEINPEKTLFGLCDGVGSSFYGNLGSQILGEILLNWLGKITPPANFDSGNTQAANNFLNKLTVEMTRELNSKTVFATNIIQRKEISSQNEMVRMAEITQRDDFGTQSNFACGIVWPASSSLPKGLVLLFWLGNARLRLFSQNQDLSSLLNWGSDPDQLLEVWSSKDGVVGNIYSYITDLSQVTSIIAYSDGLENAEGRIRPGLDGAQLEKLVQHSQSIKDDDATFLELFLSNKEIPGQADDIVPSLRKHMQSAPSSKSTSSLGDLELQKLRSAHDAPQKKQEDQVRKGNSTRWIIIIPTALFFMAFCFFAGIIVERIITPTETPTVTASSTRAKLPTRTSTPTVPPSAVESATSLTTLTVIDTPTETATPSPTETPSALPTSMTPSTSVGGPTSTTVTP